jgi:hypothetical protein
MISQKMRLHCIGKSASLPTRASYFDSKEHAMMPRLYSLAVTALLLVSALVSGCGTEPRIDFLGAPGTAAAATQTIVITPSTKSVNVTGGDIVNFIVGDKSFAWAFNVASSVSSFDLNRVAPPGMLEREVRAYVARDPKYMGGGGERSN